MTLNLDTAIRAVLPAGTPDDDVEAVAFELTRVGAHEPMPDAIVAAARRVGVTPREDQEGQR